MPSKLGTSTSDRLVWIKAFSKSIILTKKLKYMQAKKASYKNEGGSGCREGWLNPARFIILAICVMLFVIFFFF